MQYVVETSTRQISWELRSQWKLLEYKLQLHASLNFFIHISEVQIQVIINRMCKYNSVNKLVISLLLYRQ